MYLCEEPVNKQTCRNAAEVLAIVTVLLIVLGQTNGVGVKDGWSSGISFLLEFL